MGPERLVRSSECVTREIAGETIIVPVRDNVGDLEFIHTLNEVAACIWNLLDGQTDVNQIVEAMCREYDVSPEQAKKDVCEILVSLEKAGLVSASPEGTS